MKCDRQSIRSRESLLAALAEGWNPTYLPFWGHRVPADGSVGTSCFSQWYPARIELEGIAYPTAEHFMMAEKARLFADSATEEQILRTPSPAEAKRLGREVRNYVDRIWKEHRFQAVVSGNVAKFRQNLEMGAVLLNTDESVIVEASPRDLIWGIGLGREHPDVSHPARWRGQNLLGFALMETRHRLRADSL